MKKNKRVRESNFELLRIISILLIISFHYFIHGDSDSIMASRFTANKALAYTFGIWGRLGVNCFVFISAWFLVKSKFKFKKILKIIVETSLIAFVMVFVLTALHLVNFSAKAFISSILAPFTDMYWFVTAYMILYFIFPFLNLILEKIETGVMKKLIILLTIICSVYPTFIQKAPIGSVIWFIYLYLLVGYLKNNPMNFFERNAKKGFVVLTILTICFGIGMSVISSVTGKYQFQRLGNNIINDRYSIIMVVLALFLFYIFKNLNIGRSKSINYIATSTFGVYIIHENIVFGGVLWDKILKIYTFYHGNSFILLIHFIISVFIIFAVCTALEKMFTFIIDKVIFTDRNKVLNSFCDKIDGFYKGIE